MSTTTIETRCNARPTRLACVLPTPDHELLLSVFARYATLWGGIFNPIVILDSSTRRIRGAHEERHSSQPYLEGQYELLKAFDPDLLANFSSEPLPAELKQFQHRTFAADRLDWKPEPNKTFSYFVDVFPILNELWEKEFKFSTKTPFKFQYLEKNETKKSLLLTAWLGLYLKDELYSVLNDHFAAEMFSYDTQFKSTMRLNNFFTPLSLTSYKCIQRRQARNPYALLLLDPEDPFDVVDFWNLRAAGMFLFPLSLNDYKDFEQPIRGFASLWATPITAGMVNHMTLMKSRSIADEELACVADWIRMLSIPVVSKGWMPRYKMDHYAMRNEIEIEPIRGYESSAVGVLEDGYGVIQVQVPEFMRNAQIGQRWSVDLSFSAVPAPTTRYHLPWLNSGCDTLVQHKIGRGHDLDGAHISRSGIVTQQAGTTDQVRISPITTVDAVRAFLKGFGIEYQRISPPGLVLERIIEMFQGLRDCELFQNAAVRQLLDHLANGSWLLAAEVRAAINKSLQGRQHYGQPMTKEQITEMVDSILTQAVGAKVFRIGLVFQCSRCKRYNWYATTEFNDRFNCKSCFAHEPIPRLDTAKWHYVSDGFFRTSNKLDGNITILLTLNFLDHMLGHSNHFSASFDYEIDAGQHEMDFAVITGGDIFGREVEVIFGESKSGTALNEDERKKLKAFGIKTGAYLCFCTMADDFDEKDKVFFRNLVASGVKIIMLTRELLEMDYFACLQFSNENNTGRSRTKADWLLRLTIVRILGEKFAQEHHISL
jgi:hypothetical protein